MLAYHNNQDIKVAIMAQLARHRELDDLVKGHYWEGGKGCAIGCTIHSGDHAAYELLFGIPVMLARLEDRIFEGLPHAASKEWPEKFMGTIQPGDDLSLVGWHFLLWLLTDEKVNPGINHPLVADAVQQCANVLAKKVMKKQVSRNVAYKTRFAASTCAHLAAMSAWTADRTSESAARSAESAVSAMDSVLAETSRIGALNASTCAKLAAMSAWTAAKFEWSAKHTPYLLMADGLLALIEAV